MPVSQKTRESESSRESMPRGGRSRNRAKPISSLCRFQRNRLFPGGQLSFIELTCTNFNSIESMEGERRPGPMKTFSVLMCLALFAAVLFAADVDGKWKGVLNVPNMGETPVTWTFQANGNELTGSVDQGGGMVMKIKDGKIDGNKISFILPVNMQGNAMNIDYSGIVSENKIDLTLHVMGQNISYTVTKVE